MVVHGAMICERFQGSNLLSNTRSGYMLENVFNTNTNRPQNLIVGRQADKRHIKKISRQV